MQAWVQAFLFTQLVEVPIYARALSCPLLVAFGASALTHPVVWFGFFGVPWDAPYMVKLISSEIFAWLAEAAYFRFGFRRARALLWSLVANGTSLGLGLLCRHYFGVP